MGPLGAPHSGMATPSMGSLPRAAIVLLWVFVVGGCTDLESLRYELRPSANGDTLSVVLRLSFRRPPTAFALIGHASNEIAAIQSPLAFDAGGKPIPLELTSLPHRVGERITEIPRLVIPGPAPREVEIHYWLRPGVRDGNEHVGFKGKAFGLGQPSMVFVAARNVLLVPEAGLETDVVEVRVHAPAGWSVATPWNRAGDRLTPGIRGRYRDEDLLSATIAMGRLAESRFQVGGTGYEVWMPEAVPESERERALALMQRLAASVDSTIGFGLGDRYTVIATQRSAGADDVRGDAWGTGQGGTLLPMTPTRAWMYTRRLLEAHVRHQPHRRALSERGDYWVLDAVEQLVAWQLVARAGLADEGRVNAFYAAEYLSILGIEGTDPDRVTLYDRDGPRRIEREILAPFMLLWLERELSRGSGAGTRIDWTRVFETGHLSAGLPRDGDRATWERFRTRALRGIEPPDAATLLVELPLEPLPKSILSTGRHITVFFTGQTEGYLENCGCKTNQSGGIARRATVLDEARSRGDRVLVLDAGSVLARPDRQGQLDDLSREEQGFYLRATREMRYDAIAVGETELQHSHDPDVVAALADLPYVCANLETHGRPLVPPWKAIDCDGLRAGIVGLFELAGGPETPSALEQATLGLESADPVTALSRSLEAMGPVDLTVVMGRLTPGMIRKLLASRSDVDVVISTEAPTSLGTHVGPGERIITAGRSGAAVVVMSQISKYGVGELSLDLDQAGQIAAADVITRMLDESVPDDPRVRQRLSSFYDRVGQEAASQASVPALFPGDSLRSAGHYAGATTCAGCHDAEYRQWQSTPHASAYKTLLDAHRHYNPRCVVCHVVGYGTQHGYRLGTSSDALANVQCEVCHGPGAAHAARPGRDNIRRAVSESTCLQCHTPEHSEAFVFADRLSRVVHSAAPNGLAMRTGSPR